MEKVFLFIAFFIVYILYLWTTIKLSNRYVNRIKKENIFENELLVIVPNLFLFSLIFIIGQFFNLYLPLITIAASHLGILLTAIFWGLLGSPKIPYKAIGGWAGSNFALKNIRSMIFTQLLSLLILIAYPVYMAIQYFSSDSLDSIRTIALNITLILVLSGYLTLTPTIVGVLTSGFIDEDARSRYLIAQFANLIPLSLFISLLFWSLNLGTTGQDIGLGNAHFVFNPLLFSILTIFFLLFFLLPYFIGIQTSKQLKSDLFKNESKILNELTEAIDLSTDKNIIARLDIVKSNIRQKQTDLIQNDQGVALGVKYENPKIGLSLPDQEVIVYNYYNEAKSYDVRFTYIDYLNEVYLKIDELINDYMIEPDAEKKKELLKSYSAYFKEKGTELGKTNEKSSTNPKLWLAIIAILSPIISQLMTGIGNYVIGIFKKII